MPSAQEPKAKGKLQWRSPAARTGDAIRVSAKDGKSYAEILKAMKVKVNPQNAGASQTSGSSAACSSASAMCRLQWSV